MSESVKSREVLCDLLITAALKCIAVQGPIWSRYESGIQIGKFVIECRNAILKGTITSAQRRELWTIFAPTCDWDDVVGDVQLGNEIFGLLDKLYGQEIKNAGDKGSATEP